MEKTFARNTEPASRRGLRNSVALAAAVIASLLLALSFSSCREKSAEAAKPGKINVVATIFPLYDWARTLASGGEKVKVEMLLKNGVDPHSFQPTTGDIVRVSTADILIYVGGEDDKWVGDALKNAANGKMIVINLMDALKGFVKEEQTSEGAQDSAPDEHLWLSLNNAIAASNEIARALMEKDEANTQIYMANLVAFVQSVAALKTEYSGSFADRTIIVCDRFPFRYLADEFGIRYYAAFTGCSAETEASFETIAFLSDKVRELAPASVFVTESADKKIARTVLSNADTASLPVITLNSMQSVTQKQADKGAAYLDIMRANLEALR